ncbi:AraC family transcriptional regulator [Paenibacillus doosanensis]|uniref:AraC family transcriptional regulator n=1 Tax=Paenibacillus doosanensis TaxID=1229154 RepID=UPI002180232F|nr:AraC family transcriptional regulator [Paenibacillus doosanensis]MCS7460329.1 AraC family transcriptional regulator [Paenibacillus doosanensis]
MITYSEFQGEAGPPTLDETAFRLRGAELLKGEGCLVEQRLLNSYTLIVVSGGEGLLKLNEDEGLLRPNTAYTANPGDTIGIMSEAAEGVRLFVLSFDVFREERLPDAGTAYFQGGAAPLYPEQGSAQVPVTAPIVTLCDTVYGHWQSGDPLERFRSQSAFQELLYLLMKHSLYGSDRGARSGLELSKRYMDAHFHEKISVEQLAGMTGLSPKYYVDLFKKTYDIGVTDYLTLLRMNRAKQLMSQADHRLKDLAQQIGYSDEYYFSRKFKQETGVSPTVYMNSRRRKIAAYQIPITGQLLALKMIPYAAPLHPKWTGYYYKMYGSEIPVHLSAYRFNQDWEANIEKLRLQPPDLILSPDTVGGQERELLERLGEVYFVPSKATWREQLLWTAQTLREEGEAAAWLQSYEKKVKEVRERLEREIGDESCLILSFNERTVNVYNSRSVREVLYGDLQLRPACDPGAAQPVQPVTVERLAELDAQRLFVMIRQEPVSLAGWQALRQSPAWRDLRAVRTHKVSIVPSSPWREYSASAHYRIIGDMLELVARK